MQKSLKSGCPEQTSEKTFGDLVMSYVSALNDLSRSCSRLQIATLRLALPKSPTPRWSVLCGRPVSESSSKGGAKLRVVGK
jgi:hypothetical protein